VTRRRQVIVAVALWLLLAFVVWNVIFDRMIVLAGRRYSHDAGVLYRMTSRYLYIDEVMRPAVAHAARVASVAAGTLALVGLLGIRMAASRDRQP